MIRLSRIIILLGEAIWIEIMFMISIYITCPFKLYFHIPCPFCGMTRSLIALSNLNIKDSVYYNILTLPILLIIIIINIALIIEIVTNKKVIHKLKAKLPNKKTLIIICLIMSIFSILINLYHRI